MSGVGDDRAGRGSGRDSETFERWYRSHHDRLLAQCARMLSDRAAAEDVAQETLLRAWLGRERMREEDLGAWLTVVARNLCISHIRRQKKQVPSESLPESVDESSDPAVVVERLESLRAVRRAMRQVGERHRVLLFRREVNGVDYEELGSELGLTPGGTRAVLFRARRVLRDRLAAVGEGVSAILLGIRVRARTWANNVTGPVDAMASPMLQVGIALALTGGLAGTPPAIAAFGGASHSIESRPPAIAVPPATRALPRDNVSPQMEVRIALGGGDVASHRPPVTPGLTPGGDMHPSANPPLLGPLDLGSITWQPSYGPSPYPIYRRDGKSRIHMGESDVTTIVCRDAPAYCA